MKLNYENISESNVQVLHDMMTEYYREAQDRTTPQKEIDAFIGMLYDMLTAKTIDGRLIYGYKTGVVGFLLWMIDRTDSPFSELPGYGTILEIGLRNRYRGLGIGKDVVDYAEAHMEENGATDYYVLAYGPARGFWEQCGYLSAHQKGKNGLPLLIKSVDLAKAPA